VTSQDVGFVKNISWVDISMTSTDKCITINDEYKPAPKGAKNFINVSDIMLKRASGCKTDAEFICPDQQPLH
jgi:hypothetical protein